VTPSDAELVTRVLSGDDRRAFAELVRRHQSMVRGLLRRLASGDAALADDLAQDTFLRAYRALGSWRGGARFSTWLCAIAYRAWATSARRSPAPVPPEPEPRRAAADLSIDRHDLSRALASLRGEEREALALAYGQELTHEEAAEILHCPVGTLKTHVLRGKEKLRRLLLAGAEGMP
jgi:RNA polymerase sigma-70 factor (ECF subfamily)